MINPLATRTAAGFFLIVGLLVTSLRTDPPIDDAAAIVVPPNPTFQINWQPGQLSLLGHTVSQDHERRLLQVADSSFRNAEIQTSFDAFGATPDTWEDVTVKTLYLLSESESATADITANTLTIHAVTADDLGWQSRLAAVRSNLPDAIAVSSDTIVVDRSINADATCRKAVEAFDVGAINFEESSTVLRSSAYPRLDRAVALATVCYQTHIRVEGHTDATGSESWNRDLSLRRANTVVEYFARSGIDLMRIRAHGFGSEKPIAENTTRFGRSLNRRIEIDFRL